MLKGVGPEVGTNIYQKITHLFCHSIFGLVQWGCKSEELTELDPNPRNFQMIRQIFLFEILDLDCSVPWPSYHVRINPDPD